MKVFEDQAGCVLTVKLKGAKNNCVDVLTCISEKTGVVLEGCGKIITAIEEADAGLTDKLKIFLK